MFRISHVIGIHREYDRRCLDQIQGLFGKAFPDLAEDRDYIPRKLVDQTARGYPCILLAAHGEGESILGFALADFFEAIGYAYLDFIVTGAEQRGRGLGGRTLRGAPRGPHRPRGDGPVPGGPDRRPRAGPQPRPSQGEQVAPEILRTLRRPADRQHPLRPADPPRQAGRAAAPLRPAGERRTPRRRRVEEGHPVDPDAPL